MLMNDKAKIDSKTVRQISLFCIIMQSIGIRFFGGFGYIMIGFVVILNIRRFRKMHFSHLTSFLLIICAILIIGMLKEFALGAIIYTLSTILGAILVLQNYNDGKANFIKDITGILWFLCIYGLISWSLLIIIPQMFFKVNLGLNYHTFLYVLYNTFPAEGLPRLSSLMWEPGCCQFILNFLLVILVTQRQSKRKILFVAVLVILTRSTTGYINLILIMLLYFWVNKISIAKIACIFFVIFAVGLYSLVSDNITDKVANSSGIIRTRDLYVGYELAKRHPLLGVDTENLSTNKEAQVLEDEIWGGPSIWTDYQGYFAGGYTNGLMGVFLDYGMIFGLILYALILKAPIIWNNTSLVNPYCFFAVFFCSLIGEPISRTSLFFLFALSFLVNFQEKKRILQTNIVGAKRIIQALS